MRKDDVRDGVVGVRWAWRRGQCSCAHTHTRAYARVGARGRPGVQWALSGVCRGSDNHVRVAQARPHAPTPSPTQAIMIHGTSQSTRALCTSILTSRRRNQQPAPPRTPLATALGGSLHPLLHTCGAFIDAVAYSPLTTGATMQLSWATTLGRSLPSSTAGLQCF